MSEERVQPGAEVSKEEYEQFKQFVRDVHGAVRGNLGRELENAMREYRTADRDDRLQRIEDDMATVKAMLADRDVTDGGTPARPSDAACSHTQTADEPQTPSGPSAPSQSGGTPTAFDWDAPDQKPNAKASRDAKARWLAAYIDQQYGDAPGQGVVSRKDLRSDIRDQFGFGDRTLGDYIDMVMDRLNADPDPRNPQKLVAWGDRLDELKQMVEEEARDDAADDAAATMDDVAIQDGADDDLLDGDSDADD